MDILMSKKRRRSDQKVSTANSSNRASVASLARKHVKKQQVKPESFYDVYDMGPLQSDELLARVLEIVNAFMITYFTALRKGTATKLNTDKFREMLKIKKEVEMKKQNKERVTHALNIAVKMIEGYRHRTNEKYAMELNTNELQRLADWCALEGECRRKLKENDLLLKAKTRGQDSLMLRMSGGVPDLPTVFYIVDYDTSIDSLIRNYAKHTHILTPLTPAMLSSLRFLRYDGKRLQPGDTLRNQKMVDGDVLWIAFEQIG